MLINNSYFSYNNLSTNKINKTEKPQTSSPNICFKGSLKADTFEPFLGTCLGKLHHFTAEEYQALSLAEKVKLRNEYLKMINKEEEYARLNPFAIKAREPEEYQNTEIFHDVFTEKLKAKMDKKYGEGNYAVIIIGRSLSSIGKVLGYKIGEENVKQIPLTAAKRFKSNKYTEKAKHYGQLKAFNEYLSSIGLDKDTIKSSGKQYVILDFCVTGESLEGATTLLKRDDVLGKDHIIAKDVLEYITNSKLRKQAYKHFFQCDFKDFSWVDTSGTLDLTKYNVKKPEYEDIRIKLLWFKLLDNEMLRQQTGTPSAHEGLIEKLRHLFTFN